MFRIKKLDLFIARQFGQLFAGTFFISLFVLMMELTHEQYTRLENAKTKHLATPEELNPNMRFVENMFITSTHDDLMFFTNFGKVYVIKGYEIPETSRNQEQLGE